LMGVMATVSKDFRRDGDEMGVLRKLVATIQGSAASSAPTTATLESDKWRPRELYEPRSPDSVAITRDCIPKRHSELLADYIAHIDPFADPVVVFQEIATNYLPVLGASKRALQEHVELALAQYRSTYTVRVWEERLRELRSSHPYTYNLIQAACGIWVRHTAVKRYPLPLHYVVAQSRAIAARYDIPVVEYTYADTGLPPPDCIEDSAVPEILPDQPTKFAYCDVCQRVYSIVRKKPQPPKKENTRPKLLPTHGYADATVDLADGLVYCNKGRSILHMRCGDAPLKEIGILGSELIYKRSSFTLCCQPGCGQIALMHPMHTSFNEFGLACYACTVAIRSGQAKASIPPQIAEVVSRLRSRRRARYEEDEERPEPLRCFLDHKFITNENECFMFGVDTYLCKRHPVSMIRDFIHRNFTSRGIGCEIDHAMEGYTRSLLLQFDGLQKDIDKITNERKRKTESARIRQAKETARILR
jgi:hypothetical protein